MLKEIEIAAGTAELKHVHKYKTKWFWDQAYRP